MTNNTDLEAMAGTLRGQRVKMAYALKNRQPVLCSILSDQPLYYMDFNAESEEDLAEFDALFGLDAIERDLSALKARIEDLEAFERAQSEPAAVTLDFIADLRFATEKGAALSFSGDYEFERAALLSVLKQSRLASAYLETAQQYSSEIRMSAEIETALYDRKDGHIYINPNIAMPEQILLASRELRRLWQHRNGALINPLTFHPDQAILVNRAQIADLMASMVRIAWELQLSGEKSAWERIESSPMSDLARAFARESYLDFRTLNNGIAASAVFEAWFLSERCRHEDRRLIQLMLADYQGYVFENAQSSKAITSELIMALGSMPFGKNYLSPYIMTIMNDALFTEVRDRSNANFLWFIKFERSFREAEQELQTENNVQSQDQLGLNINNRFGDQHEKTAEIISLPKGADQPSPMDKGAALSGGARIIQFRGKSGSH